MINRSAELAEGATRASGPTTGGQARLSDVYYRAWILSTMGMNPEQVAGRVRLRWAGTSSPSVMSLQCLS